jgi:hypothetical protein
MSAFLAATESESWSRMIASKPSGVAEPGAGGLDPQSQLATSAQASPTQIKRTIMTTPFSGSPALIRRE